MDRCIGYPTFQLFSEHIRGEKRFYWIARKDGHGKHWKIVSVATTDKRKAQRDWDRLVAEKNRKEAMP